MRGFFILIFFLFLDKCFAMNIIVIISVVIIFTIILVLQPNKTENKTRKPNFNKRKKLISEYEKNKQINPEYLTKNKNIVYNIHHFTDKKVAITGTFKKFASRNELAKLLWDQGAIIDTKFNSNTDYLIVGTSVVDSQKIKSAFYLNIKVLTEDELLKYFNVPELEKELIIKEQYQQ